MSKLYVIVGIPASGKSYLAERMEDILPHTVHISRDKVRFSMLKETDEYFNHEKAVFHNFTEKINEQLDCGYDVIADATHITEVSRYKLLNAITAHPDEIIAIVVNCPLNICLERNEKRTGRAKVPENVIKDMYNRKTKPRIDEGFNSIITIERKV